jgi:membrane protease YdiL (CAAX protease family)
VASATSDATARTRRDLADAALVASIVAFHVVDHTVVPARWQLPAHTVAGGTAVAAAAALGASAGDLGVEASKLPAGLRLGAVSAALVLGGLAASARVPALEEVLSDPRVEAASGRELALRATVEIPLGTAVYEELVFRSALLGLALRRLPRPAAVAVVSGLFGLWHVFPALHDRELRPAVARLPVAATVVPTVAGTALAGAGFAALRLRSGSVVAPLLAHVATNVGALLASAAVVARRRRSVAQGPAEAGSAEAGPAA